MDGTIIIVMYHFICLLYQLNIAFPSTSFFIVDTGLENLLTFCIAFHYLTKAEDTLNSATNNKTIPLSYRHLQYRIWLLYLLLETQDTATRTFILRREM